MGEGEEAWANKACLVRSLDIEWKQLNHGALVEFLNIFVINGFEIYFGKRGIMYVINKQIMTNAFGVCQSGYIKDSKGQMNKMVVELLFSHDIKPPYTNADQWNVKKRKIPYNIKYPVVIFVVY